jgi:hypothetical protein
VLAAKGSFMGGQSRGHDIEQIRPAPVIFMVRRPAARGCGRVVVAAGLRYHSILSVSRVSGAAPDFLSRPDGILLAGFSSGDAILSTSALNLGHGYSHPTRQAKAARARKAPGAQTPKGWLLVMTSAMMTARTRAPYASAAPANSCRPAAQQPASRRPTSGMSEMAAGASSGPPSSPQLRSHALYAVTDEAAVTLPLAILCRWSARALGDMTWRRRPSP